jgi:chemotaxis protein methyltransferase CheR
LYPAADVVLCRNVLIYFNRPAQGKILHALADILTEDGILVLGKSETMPASLRNRFATLDPVERIYCRV